MLSLGFLLMLPFEVSPDVTLWSGPLINAAAFRSLGAAF